MLAKCSGKLPSSEYLGFQSLAYCVCSTERVAGVRVLQDMALRVSSMCVLHA